MASLLPEVIPRCAKKRSMATQDQMLDVADGPFLERGRKLMRAQCHILHLRSCYSPETFRNDAPLSGSQPFAENVEKACHLLCRKTNAAATFPGPLCRIGAMTVDERVMWLLRTFAANNCRAGLAAVADFTSSYLTDLNLPLAPQFSGNTPKNSNGQALHKARAGVDDIISARV